MANTFFGVSGQITQNSLRWIIRFGRQYPIAAASYLVFFFFALVSCANQPVASPPSSSPSEAPSPTTTPSPLPTENPTPNPTPTDTPSPSPSPVVSVAQLIVYITSVKIIVRFNRPVSNVQMTANGKPLDVKCEELNICTIATPEEAFDLGIIWNQDGESFSKQVKLGF